MKLIPLVCLLGFCLQVTAQKNYQKGLAVLTNGDTLKGWIDYRNWRINPAAINFKQDSLAENFQQFTIADISFFQVAGERYLKAFVKKDMLPVELNDLVTAPAEKEQTDTAFLRIIVQGPVLNLYELFDFKAHYYIQDSTQSYTELIYKRFMGEDAGNVIGVNLYRNQLIAYLFLHPQNEKKLTRQIERMGYNDKAIGQVVASLNGLAGHKTSYVSDYNRKMAISFYGGTGITFNRMKFYGENPYLTGMHFDRQTAPVVMIGTELFSERNLKDVSLRIELAYGALHYTGNGFSPGMLSTPDTIQYEVKQRTFSPSITLLYHIIRKAKFRYYAGLQCAFNFSSYTANDLTVRTSISKSFVKDYFPFDKTWPMIGIKTGAIINRRWDVSVTASLYSSNAHTTTTENKIKQYALWLGYRFK